MGFRWVVGGFCYIRIWNYDRSSWIEWFFLFKFLKERVIVVRVWERLGLCFIRVVFVRSRMRLAGGVGGEEVV